MLRLIDSGKFEICLSVPLFLEYEAACKRFLGAIPLTEQDLDDILDYLCQVAHQQKVFYLWRAFLPDAGDDMVLELASAAGCAAKKSAIWNTEIPAYLPPRSRSPARRPFYSQRCR